MSDPTSDPTSDPGPTGPTLTRAEDLLFEVLIARHRLQDTPYHVGSRHAPTLRALETKGLIWFEHGNVERTYKASLTILGEIVGIAPNHTPPALSPTCRSFYFGPLAPFRVDCGKRTHHRGKHKARLLARTDVASTVAWTDEEACGLDDPRYADRLRDAQRREEHERARLKAAITEGRLDWTTGTIRPATEAAAGQARA